MYTKIQTLVDAAYRRSGTVGDGQTPSANDSTAALELVNGILDTLSLDGAFTPGIISRSVIPVTSVPQADVTVASRKITDVTSSSITGLAVVTTQAAHGLAVGDSIYLYGSQHNNGVNQLDGIYTVTIANPLTPLEFTASGAKLTTSDVTAVWMYAGESSESTTPSIIIANVPSRAIITTAASTGFYAVVTTTAAHGLTVGTSVDLYGTGGADGTYLVSAVPSLTTFRVTGVVVSKSSTLTGGGWKLTSEGREYRIDLSIEPPTEIKSFICAGSEQAQITADGFYSRELEDGEWYYETSTDPYPTIYANTAPGTIAFKQPGFVNVTLNTSTAKWPRGLDQAIMHKLAGMLAIGYPETVATCEAAYNNAISQFKIAHRKTRSIVADDSSPGYNRKLYDFDSDTWG